MRRSTSRGAHAWVAAVLVAALSACATGAGPSAATGRKGHLILIGGGEKPVSAMRKFVELAGGRDAPIVIIPTASGESDAELAEYYAKLFREEYGHPGVELVSIHSREDAARPELVEKVARARGIFFAGGDQTRITKALLDTAVGRAIESAFAAGAVVGGTSAGTACQSALMITGEGDFTVIRSGAVELVRGLGLVQGVILDQHFVARQRLNRLLGVVLEHPDQLGVGIDEDTAAWIRPDGTLEVLGESSVVVLDAKRSTVSKNAASKGKPLLGVAGLTLHVLVPGDRFDLVRRALVPASKTRADQAK